MDTKNLECFLVTYEQKSFNKASKKLFLSPQGLGKNIKKLEDELDTILFYRSPSGLIPTKSADFLYKKAGSIHNQLDSLLTDIHNTALLTKSLDIGLSFGVLRAIPINFISNYINKYPELNVRWSEYENEVLCQKLEDGEIDFGLYIGDIEGSSLNVKLLKEIPIVALVYKGHPFFSEDSLDIEMLKNENILLMNEKFRIHQEFIRACETRGFLPKIFASVADGGTLEVLCSQGAGIAISPLFELGSYDNIKAIPFKSAPTWNIYCAWKKDSFEISAICEELKLII